MSLQFDFPADLTTEKFIAKPGNKPSTLQFSRQYSLKTYYDSFDQGYQGFAVLENTLKLFSEKMLSNNSHANTFLAMRVLIQNLGILRCNVRTDFSSKCAAFKPKQICVQIAVSGQ